MPMCRILLLLIASVAASSVSLAGNPLTVLFLGDQRSHQPASRFAILEPEMRSRGITLTYTEDVTKLNADTLSAFDGLMLYANIDEISADQAKALMDYVAGGKGFIPIHCATYCFRNSPDVVALMGAQFQKHGTGEMTTESGNVQHPILHGYETFTSWDETYVHHLHNPKNRIVLEYRAGDMQADGNSREPWTWIRSHGDGRVFYTAWGHDQRTWRQPRFHDLIERGVRWACGEGELGIKPTPELPKMKKAATDLPPVEFVDVGPKIPELPGESSMGRAKEAAFFDAKAFAC